MHSVFLSYAREDCDRAKTVAAAFEDAGLSIWWDRRIDAGSEYSKEIEQALKSARAVVVLWSRSAVDSPWVRDEAAKGRDSGKLVPASFDGIEAPLGFGQFHTIDLSSRRWRRKPLDELVAATARKLQGERDGPASAPALAKPKRAMPAIQPAVAGSLVLAVAAAAAIYIFAAPGSVSPEAGESKGGKVAIAGFSPISEDAETRRVARLTDGAVERTLATNFIQTLSAQSASRSALEDADFTLRGTVDRSGDEVTILASVIDPESGRTLWSTEISREVDESRELTEELAIYLADVIRCSAYTKRRMPGYDSAEVRSRIFRTCEAERSGGRQYEQLPALAQALIDVAPESAQAWAYLANGMSLLYPDRREQVHAAVKRALELDPDNGAARWSLAILPDPNVGLAQRERLLLDGLKLDPDFLWFRNHLGHLMRKVGRTEEAAKWYGEFVSNYPLDHQTRSFAAYLAAQRGRITEAREEFERIAEVRPWYRTAPIYAIRAEVFFGDADRAYRWLDGLAVTEEGRRCVDATVSAIQSGRKLTVDQVRRTCLQGAGILHPAQVLAKFGHTEALIEFLAEHDPPYIGTQGSYFLFEPIFAQLRADPRFIPLLVRFGIPQYWLETNKWPDFCSKEELPYDCREAAAAAVRKASS